MAWTSPRTWVANAVLAAAQLNTDVRDNLNYIKGVVDGTGTDKIPNAALATGIDPTKLLAAPGFLAYAPGSWVVLNNTQTSLFCTGELFDNGGLHSTSVNTHTGTTTPGGVWLVGAQMSWPSNAAGDRMIEIFSPTLGYLARSRVGANPSGPTGHMCSVVVNFPAGDTVQFFVTQSSGGSLTMASYPDNAIWAFRLGA